VGRFREGRFPSWKLCRSPSGESFFEYLVNSLKFSLDSRRKPEALASQHHQIQIPFKYPPPHKPNSHKKESSPTQ
jgi:hypothetical protein